MLPRKKPDIGWADLAHGLAACLRPPDPDVIRAALEESWAGEAHSLACLSVRSGLDLLLRMLDWPAGSEVLVSAVTIRDMVRIIEHHGLVAVPVDVDPATAAPCLQSFGRLVGPRSKGLLVAHLFGSRMELEPYAAFARAHGLVLIEDAAQGFAADGDRGHPASDVSLFSFGPIKTATALGGAMLRFGNPDWCKRVEQLQVAYPRQRRRDFARRLLKYTLLKALTSRPLYSAFVWGCQRAGRSHDEVINRSVRGFAGPDFSDRIRLRPSAPLLALLARRLARYQPRDLAARIADAACLSAGLKDVERPGQDAERPTHWVFPVLSRDPDGLVAGLLELGFDATRGASSMAAVPAPEGLAEPANAIRMMDRVVYLPVGSGARPGELERMAGFVRRFEQRERGQSSHGNISIIAVEQGGGFAMKNVTMRGLTP